MDNKQFSAQLKKIDACKEAREWVKSHGGTFAECWNDCGRGDWMAWLVAIRQKKLGITKRQLVGALADCAALSLKYYEKEYPKDKRVRECINTCRRYAQGKATDEELTTAADAAADAAAYAAFPADAAAYAADAAAHVAYAAAYVAYAAACVAYAADAAAYAAARTKTLKKCADVFRKHFPELLEKE